MIICGISETTSRQIRVDTTLQTLQAIPRCSFAVHIPYFCSMNIEYRHLLPAGYDPASRVWIFQSSNLFTPAELPEVENMLNDFSKQWLSHGADVKNFAAVFFNRFIILMADDTHTHVGGCSTDSMQRFIKKMEAQFGISLFDRQTLAFVINDEIQTLPMRELASAVENNFITADTLYFNNTALTRKDLEDNWLIKVKDSWLARKLTFPLAAH